MTDIPEDVKKLARHLYGVTRRNLERASIEIIARAISADRAAQAERMARLEEALRPFADEFRRLEKNYVGFEIMFTDDVVYVGGKLTIGHLRRAALGNGGGDA